jgi:two-component system sensor histidine kinase SenX3
MELLIGLVIGVIIGAGAIYAWNRKLRPQDNEEASFESRSSNFTISNLIRSLPNIAIWLDADNKVIFASESALSLNIVRDEKVQIDAIENIVFSVRKSSSPIYEDLKVKRPLGISRLSLSIWAIRLERGEVLIWAQDNSQLGRVEAVRRDFIANISHELKTPVGALSLIAEAIEQAGDDTETIKKFAKRIGPETKRLTNVIRDIIDLSQVQSDDPLANASVVDVDRALNDAVDATQLLADLHAIDLQLIKVPDAKIVGDHHQLVMAVRNLLTNAITFSPPSSRITVGAKALGGIVEITVSDQGIGISLEEQGRVFERFYRVDPARSRATGGTGLGLAIVKNVCENHGGEVSLWSVPGQGSTFTMKLPQYENEINIDEKQKSRT